MKRPVLLFDGTWNDDTPASKVTNVFRLRELVEAANRSQVVGGSQAVPQRIYYDEGIRHARPYSPLSGWSDGWGLSENIKQAYRFLASTTQPGTAIATKSTLLGFTGAFMARSLAGSWSPQAACLRRNIATSKILRSRGNTTVRHQKTGIRRTRPRSKNCACPMCASNSSGVFDTVGALGIPIEGLKVISPPRFHDTKLGSIIDYAYHAVAIDEFWSNFVPALWSAGPQQQSRGAAGMVPRRPLGRGRGFSHARRK